MHRYLSRNVPRVAWKPAIPSLAAARHASAASDLAPPRSSALPTSSGGVLSAGLPLFRPFSSSSIAPLRKDVENGQDHRAAESQQVKPRRSMLYVPGSSEKMIKKSQTSPSDCIIFDLEDSVAAHRKSLARETVFHALEAAARPGPELAVRINPPSGDQTLSGDDLDMILPSTQLETIVVPKVEHEDDVRFIIAKAKSLRSSQGHKPLSLVLSVESAASLLRMPTIIEKIRSDAGSDGARVAEVSALLFASEDYCASTGIIRTRSRRELLFPRSQMATIAKAYGLAAIDMVCIDYKDMAYLSEECTDGTELGFDGKQAIHPSQVETIQQKFAPSEEAIAKAARIKHLYELSVQEHKGAYGLEEGGSMIMIDAPLLLQADSVLSKARAAGLTLPDATQKKG